MGNLESCSKVGYLSRIETSGNTSRCYAILNGSNLSLYKSRDKAPQIVCLSEYKAIKKMGDSFEIIPNDSNHQKMAFKCGSDYDDWCRLIQAAIEGEEEDVDDAEDDDNAPDIEETEDVEEEADDTEDAEDVETTESHDAKTATPKSSQSRSAVDEEKYDPFAAMEEFEADVQKSKKKGNSPSTKSNSDTVSSSGKQEKEEKEEEDDDLLRQVRELNMTLKKTQKEKSDLQRKLSMVASSQEEQQELLKKIRRQPVPSVYCPPVPKVAKKVDPDVCWEFNSKAGCKNSQCQWKHVKYPTYSLGRGRGKENGKGSGRRSGDDPFKPFGKGTDIMKKVIEDNKRLGMGHKYGTSNGSGSATASNGKAKRGRNGKEKGNDQRKKGQRYEEALRVRAKVDASRDLDVCWEFNSWSGCSKDRECLWSHQWLVNEAVHPWTGEKLPGIVARYMRDPKCMDNDAMFHNNGRNNQYQGEWMGNNRGGGRGGNQW